MALSVVILFFAYFYYYSVQKKREDYASYLGCFSKDSLLKQTLHTKSIQFNLNKLKKSKNGTFNAAQLFKSQK